MIWRSFIFLSIFAVGASGCNMLDQMAEDGLFGLIPAELPADQGHVEFRDDGNILVVLNNVDFHSNPLYSDASIIMVWVYPRGADPARRCCSGSGCPAIESQSCLTGVGFSNDLGFVGSYYLNTHPPFPFDRKATQHYIPVYVSDKTGTPQNYQGDYQTFSSPVQAIADRSRYDLYLGVFFSAFSPEYPEPRVLSVEAQASDQTIYSPVAPDLLSPKIEIEARFFPESREDPAGSWYTVPFIASWTPSSGSDQGLRFRNRIRINEIGNAINGVTANDFVELYNPTAFSVPLYNVYLQRWSGSGTACATLDGGNEKMNLSAYSIPPFGRLTLARSGHSLSGVDAIFTGSVIVGDTDCFALTFDNNSLFNLSDRDLIDFVGLAGGGNSETAPASALFPNMSLSRCPEGSDTNNNSVDLVVRAPTPGAGNDCVNSGDPTGLVINEWGDDTSTNLDYIELKNLGPNPARIDASLRIVYGGKGAGVLGYLPAGINDPAQLVAISSALDVASGEIVLVANSDVTAGDLAALRAFSGFTGRILLSSETTLIGANDRLHQTQARLTNGFANWSYTPFPFTPGTSTYSSLKPGFTFGTSATDDNAQWCNGIAPGFRTPGVNNPSC